MSRQWSVWSASTILALPAVRPTNLGTSTSAAVVGGDVDKLGSVRATMGKVGVEVFAVAPWLVGSVRSSVLPNIAPISTRTTRMPPKNAKGWRRRKDWTPPSGSWDGVGGGGPQPSGGPWQRPADPDDHSPIHHGLEHDRHPRLNGSRTQRRPWSTTGPSRT